MDDSEADRRVKAGEVGFGVDQQHLGGAIPRLSLPAELPKRRGRHSACRPSRRGGWRRWSRRQRRPRRRGRPGPRSPRDGGAPVHAEYGVRPVARFRPMPRARPTESTMARRIACSATTSASRSTSSARGRVIAKYGRRGASIPAPSAIPATSSTSRRRSSPNRYPDRLRAHRSEAGNHLSAAGDRDRRGGGRVDLPLPPGPNNTDAWPAGRSGGRSRGSAAAADTRPADHGRRGAGPLGGEHGDTEPLEDVTPGSWGVWRSAAPWPEPERRGWIS